MSSRAPLTGWLLVGRSLARRRAQTVLIVVVSALISGTAVFAAGYQHQVQQALADATFGVDGPGNTWTLTGEPGRRLPELLPPASERLTLPPVAGRIAGVKWQAERPGGLEATGTLQSRDEVCRHLVMVSGQCPGAASQVAVSTDDVRAYALSLGDTLNLVTTIGTPGAFIVAGIYRPADPGEPYWFGVSPTGRSQLDTADEKPRADALITVPETFEGRVYQQTLNVRVDRAAVRTTDLATLRSLTRQLSAAATDDGSRLTTGVPQSLDRIARERSRAVAGLTLSLAQLAVLVGVVLTLLASVELSAQRGELGLGRLRGEPVGRLRRLVLARWAAVVSVGWLVGWVPGLGLLALLGERLPGQRGLLVGPALALVPLAVLLATVAVIVPPTRGTLAQPVIGLLRSAPAAARDGGARQLMIDVGLLVLTVSGLLVAVQAGTTSVLGLMVPSLMAVGLGVVLFRLLVRVSGWCRRRAPTVRRPALLLTATLVERLRGLRLLTVGTTVAVAFAVFAVQLQVIGSDVRRHDAQVRSGATTVLQVTGEPAAVLRALAQVDPRHDTDQAGMTAVVVTRRRDDRALRGMFVEPAAFARIAYGADRTTDPTGWQRIAAPPVDPVTFTADALTVEVGRHGDLGRASSFVADRRGTRADLSVDYVEPDGGVVSLPLGSLSLTAGGGERLRQPVRCQAGCRLVRLALKTDGPTTGRLPLVIRTERVGVARPLDPGPVDRWSSVPTTRPEDRLGLARQGSAVLLDAETEGLPLAVQHAWVPLVLPVLAAAGANVEPQSTVAAPDGSPLAVDAVVRATDAVPGQLAGVAVGDLGSALHASGAGVGSATTVQIWVSAAADGRRAELERALAEAGTTVAGVSTVAEAEAANRAGGSALSSQVAPPLAALALGLAALGVALTVAAQARVLRRDLAGLRVAGVQAGTLRRATTAAYLLPVLLAVVAGAVAGAIGCGLVIGDLPMLADPQPAIRNDLRLRWLPLAGCVLVAAGVLATTVLVGISRVSRGAAVEQLREAS